MPRYVLDTQRYISVLAGRAGAPEVLAFVRAFAGSLDFHALVGAELLYGAHAAGEPRAIRRRIIDPFRPGRVIVPDAADLFRAGDVVREMAAEKGPHPELERRAFWNDVLIAVSCRRRGAVLLTDDADHARIARFVGHAWRADFPAR